MKSNSKKGNSDLCYFDRKCNTMFANDEGKEEDHYIYEISGLEDDGAD